MCSPIFTNSVSVKIASGALTSSSFTDDSASVDSSVVFRTDDGVDVSGGLSAGFQQAVNPARTNEDTRTAAVVLNVFFIISATSILYIQKMAPKCCITDN